MFETSPVQLTIHSRIKRLDNRLANQIAAGEVVERPASVVKELLENSIDANANRVEVEIERGGTRLIRVTDNGCGILKDDLSLALSRHATSKISKSSDLASINSLGFRGEALASIASVSRLCLTSRTKDSDLAWQAIAEGRDMIIDIQPASAIVGTRIEVRDLFYNTPARQKFLRAEKTEFGHVEEIFKRHALVNFDTAFILKHNHKVVKRVPASQNNQDQIKRIEAICGKLFAENSIEFSCQHDALNMKGWLGKPSYNRSESDIQYVFINGRPVKDKMLNHAIRQSYQGLLPAGRMATFVIFITINPTKIDVNVHPTKHEVRFNEQRLVHDLIVKSIHDALNEEPCLLADSSLVAENRTSSDSFLNTNTNLDATSETGTVSESSNYSFNTPVRNRNVGVAYSQVSYTEKPNIFSKKAISSETSSNEINSNEINPYGIDINNSVNINKINLTEGVWIVFYNQHAYILDEAQLFQNYFCELLIGNIQSQSKPLLFPQNISFDLSLLEEVETVTQLNQCGFVFEPKSKAYISLKEIPTWLNDFNKNKIIVSFPKWVEILASNESVEQKALAIYEQINPLPEGFINFLCEQQLVNYPQYKGLNLITLTVAKELLK